MTSSGDRMHALVRELYPVPRSITGDGLRTTLRRLAQEFPLTLHEVPSGTAVLDWVVPPEWNVREAWIEGPDGRRVVDMADHNLHLVGYSTPVQAALSLAELRPHLHSLPDQPERIPYRTSYYTPSWGFCLPHRVLEGLPDGSYAVRIDSTLDAAGSLTYAEGVVEGTDAGEVLISCHACHPSLANDNLSGLAVAVELARALADRHPRFTYRFVFLPGTIGSITWLARNPDAADRIRHGLVLTGVGDPGGLTYKRSRRGTALVDRAATHVLSHASGASVRDFTPWGYDERQYCSPGFDLPVGCLMRTPHGEYPEYHTSGDTPDLLTADALDDTLARLLDIVEVMEHDGTWVNTAPRGEPQLGRRGLYRAVGGTALPDVEFAMLWVLNQSDGSHSLLDIAERSGLPFRTIHAAAEALHQHDLLTAARD